MSHDSNSTPGIGIPRQTMKPGEYEQLLSQLRDFSEETRQQAAAKLGVLGSQGVLGGTQTVDALIGRTVNDNSPRVRLSAIDALFQIGDSRAWPVFVSRLADDPDAGVRLKLAARLGLIGDKSFAQPLVEALEDKERGVAEQAAHSLGLIKNPEVIPALVKELGRYRTWFWKDNVRNEEDTSVLYRNALVNMGIMTAPAVLNSATVLKTGGQNITGSGYWSREFDYTYIPANDDVRCFYDDHVDVLTQFGYPVSNMITKAAIANPEPTLRIVAARVLTVFDNQEANDFLRKLARDDSLPEVRWLATGGLGGKPAEQVIGTLISALKLDVSPLVRHKAAEVLGNARFSRALGQLCATALADTDVDVRKESIRSLGRLRQEQAIPYLGQIIYDEPNSELRVLAIQAIQEINASGNPDSARYIDTAMGADADERVRAAAVKAAAALQTAAVLDRLSKIMDQDASLVVRRAAVRPAAKLVFTQAAGGKHLSNLQKWLRVDDQAIRLEAIGGIGEARADKAYDYLIGLLRVKADYIKEQEQTHIIKILAEAGYRNAISQLRYLSKHAGWPVKSEAEKALEVFGEKEGRRWWG